MLDLSNALQQEYVEKDINPDICNILFVVQDC